MDAGWRPWLGASAGATLVALAIGCTDAGAQDLVAGRRKAVACQTCHGLDGLSRLPEAPNLAASPRIYLERSLRAYRGGERHHEVMTVMAKTMSDEDIRDLAAYFSAIVIEVKEVPGGMP
jgi:cytochrome c553